MRKANFVMPGLKPSRSAPAGRHPDLWIGRPLQQREQQDLSTYQPLSDWYRVQLLPKVEQTPGGVWLPDTVRMNWTDAIVMAAGPGQRLADGSRSVMWVDVGERVLFMKHALSNFQEATREGMVRDQDLIAVGRDRTPDRPEPLNGWCLVEPSPWEERASEHILWAEEDRPRPLHGRLLEMGPGEVRSRGPLAGTRKPVWEALGFSKEQHAENLLGKAQVYWDRQCQALAIGRSSLEYLLIQAADFWAYQEED
jgi:chaperonin GroES